MENGLINFEQPNSAVAIPIDVNLLEGFTQRLNDAIPKEEIQINTFANNSQFLPISFVQMKLDEIYMGAWQTRNFKAMVVANEIVGEIELYVFHPVLKQWICRVGSAATPIQLKAEYEKDENGEFRKDSRGNKIKKEKDILDASKKIENTLVKDYPHLMAECVKSAAKTLGKIFGRDLNRKHEDSYTPIYTIEISTEEVISKINECPDLPCLVDIWNEYPILHKNKEFKNRFTAKKLKFEQDKREQEELLKNQTN